MADDGSYNELAAYTLAHGDPAFIHQHVVDAFAAQHASDDSKPIGVAFALIGLYLHVERGFSGRQVQLVHMELSRRGKHWPSFPLPRERGAITAFAVISAPPGPDRDQAIDAWCASVWNAFHDSRQAVADLLKQHGIT